MAGTDDNGFTLGEWRVITALKDRGYALIVWTPDELQTADPTAVEDRCTEFGWDVIDSLIQKEA